MNYDGDPTYFDPLTDINPVLWDTDGDGISDGDELLYGTDPLDAGDYILPGDVNFDHQVDLADYLAILRYVLGIDTSLSSPAVNAGDLNRNGGLDAGDLTLHLQLIM